MRKIATLFFAIGLLSTVACLKTKDYTCECDYIAGVGTPSEGQPDKKETSIVKARLLEDARVECGMLENKYSTNWFSGTCQIK